MEFSVKSSQTKNPSIAYYASVQDTLINQQRTSQMMRWSPQDPNQNRLFAYTGGLDFSTNLVRGTKVDTTHHYDSAFT